MPTINSEKRHLTILSSQVTSLQHKLFRQEFKSTIIIILKASSDQKKDTNWLVYQLVGLARAGSLGPLSHSLTLSLDRL